MRKTFVVLALLSLVSALGYAAGPYQSLILKNQFGETSINSVVGGSNQVNLSFVVAPSDVGGTGINSLSQFGLPANGVTAVYMHTTATPSTNSPNPGTGIIQIQLASNYSNFVNGLYELDSPVGTASPTPVTTPLSQNGLYVISSVGTTTQAGWQLIGLYPGVVPSPGLPFIVPSPKPSSTFGGALVSTGTGMVSLTSQSGITGIEVVGTTGNNVSATGGAVVILQALNGSTPTAPVAGTRIKLQLQLKALPSALK